jgi:putative spermidine/putrescine transport system permease protein
MQIPLATGQSLLLLAPLLLFLVRLLRLATFQHDVAGCVGSGRAAPSSAQRQVLADWDRKSPPTIPMQVALTEDLKAVDR